MTRQQRSQRPPPADEEVEQAAQQALGDIARMHENAKAHLEHLHDPPASKTVPQQRQR